MTNCTADLVSSNIHETVKAMRLGVNHDLDTQ